MFKLQNKTSKSESKQIYNLQTSVNHAQGFLLCLFLMEANSSRTVWSVDLAKASAVAQYP